MASGWRTLLLSQRERALSNDILRLQKFIDGDLGDLLGWMLLSTGIDEDEAGGVAALTKIITTPSTALILNGLLFRPATGVTTNCSVDEGVVAIVSPNESIIDPDDSPIKFVHDPGLPVGTLNLTANASGSTRIDVIECQRAETVLETATRDVFNLLTKVYSAQSVNKVTASRLTYRIRLGTPGAGMPANQSDWLPLAVASVPNGAVKWDDCVIWDVRPLLADLNIPGVMRSTTLPNAGRQNWYADDQTGGKLLMRGMLESKLGFWRVGGYWSNLAGAGLTDLRDAEHLEAGAAFGANTMWNLYLAHPYGLPRWARYADVPPFSNRVPKGPRGLPILSPVGCTAAGGPAPPGTSLNIPTTLAAASGQTTANAVQIAAGWCSGTTPSRASGVGGWQDATTFAGGGIVAFSVGGGVVTFHLVDATDVPGNARRVKFRVHIQADGTNSLQGYFKTNVIDLGSAASIFENRVPFRALNATTDSYEFDVEVPWQATWRDNMATNTRSVTITPGGGATVTLSAVVGNHTIKAVGWTLSDQ